MSKDAYYFPHDSNARNDRLMLLLRAKFGGAGYGNYFMIVEMLREEDNFKLPNNELLFSSLTLSLGMPEKDVIVFIAFCEKLKLLTRDGTGLYSRSLIRRMEKIALIREERRKAGRAGAAKLWQKDGKPPSKPMALKESKGKEVKEVKKEKKRTTTEPQALAAAARPSLNDVTAYCLERKNGIDPALWISHYEANGWRVGRNPMRDWRAAVRTWERNGINAPPIKSGGGALPPPGCLCCQGPKQVKYGLCRECVSNPDKVKEYGKGVNHEKKD